MTQSVARGRRASGLHSDAERRNEKKEAWVLVHIEVQGQRVANFAERMYIYNGRLYDRYTRQVASLAVLTDDSASWRPSRFEYELWGSRALLEFATAKLLDYRERWADLEQSDNPFAIAVMAHLRTLETRSDLPHRARSKFRLTKMLYERGYTRKDIIALFHFIDWVMTLPDALKG